MNAELDPSLSATLPSLHIGPAPLPGRHELLRFVFDGESGDGWWSGLPCIGGKLSTEHWQTCSPVQTGEAGDIRWTQSEGLLCLTLDLDDGGQPDLAETSYAAYRSLLDQVRRHRHPFLLRAWNFMPAINQGDGDQERYRRFCLGRSRALEEAGLAAGDLCAGTAIGCSEGRVRLCIVSSINPGIHIENPRQLSAWRYPRRYGPRSPSFARATACPQADGEVLLLISGTASVIGHETRHADDLDAQIDETLLNIDAVLDSAASQLGRPTLAQFNAGSLLRVYVRHAEHWPQIEARLQQKWPQSARVALHGDICRNDLLVEIEAVTRG